MNPESQMKPRILFIINLPPPVHGAGMVGKYIQESKVIQNRFVTKFINLSTSRNLKETGKGGGKKLLRLLKIQAEIFKVISREKFDLCYITLSSSGLGFYKDLFVVSLLKFFGQNIIYHLHDKGVAIAANNKFNDYLYRFTFNRTKSILLSHLLYTDIQKYVKTADVYFCANGIPVSTQGEENSDISPNDNSRPCRLLFLSNMMVEKGVFTLLMACKYLKAKGLLFECHFVGAWSNISEEMFINEVDKNNLSNEVFAHGPKYKEEKLLFLTNSDIFIFPTHYDYETFGLVNLEAMQYGLPVVASQEGGIPDVVIDGETGFIVPKKNVMLLVEKLEILIKNPELRWKMGQAGKKRFYSHFTLEHFENNLGNILERATCSNVQPYDLSEPVNINLYKS